MYHPLQGFLPQRLSRPYNMRPREHEFQFPDKQNSIHERKLPYSNFFFSITLSSSVNVKLYSVLYIMRSYLLSIRVSSWMDKIFIVLPASEMYWRDKSLIRCASIEDKLFTDAMILPTKCCKNFYQIKLMSCLKIN